MFSNNEEKKLDWMYKGPTALVDREAYLLGRTVDKTLEELNKEEAAKNSDKLIVQPKNHVEHECIPPSIRDYNKIVKSEQVDLQAKLQEDPLVLIKRQEEETRRQFLQNPVQLKKLQEAIEAQKNNKKKTKTDKKLKKKLRKLNKQLGKKHGFKGLEICSDDDDEAILDTILMHKFNMLKNELSEDDLKNILLGNSSGSDNSDSDNDRVSKIKKEKRFSDSESEEQRKGKRYRSSKTYESDNDRVSKIKKEKRFSDSEEQRKGKRYRSSKTYVSDNDRVSKIKKEKRFSDSESEEQLKGKRYRSSKTYVTDTPVKNKNIKESSNLKLQYKSGIDKKNPTPHKKGMTEEEKEALRKSMMEHAAVRNAESAKNFRKYKEERSKPEIVTEHDKNFVRNQLLKAANISSVADRIKANVNNIQRSKFAMDSNFLK